MSDTRGMTGPLTGPGPAVGGGRAVRSRPGRHGWREVTLAALPVVAIAGLALPQVIHHARSSDAAWGILALLSALLVAPLVLRRRFPLSVLAVLCVLVLVQGWTRELAVASAGLLLGVYAVARRYPLHAAAPAGIVAAAAAGPIAARLLRGFAWAEVAVVVLAFVLAALMSGAFVRNRAETIAALTAAADQLAEEQAEKAEAAAARERTMIAREMHDIVAHSLSVMVTLSDAAALKVASHPTEAVQTMERVSQVGRQALGDSRRVLGVLHGESAGPLSPQPELSDLAVLVDQVDHAGLEARLTVRGPVEVVPAGAGLTAFRIAQEATANTLKHAHAATRLDVEVTVEGGVLRLRVQDDGAGVPAHSGPARAGRGLPGMHERAAAYGGTVTAGPAPEGGWRVLAHLPFDDSSSQHRDLPRGDVT